MANPNNKSRIGFIVLCGAYTLIMIAVLALQSLEVLSQGASLWLYGLNVLAVAVVISGMRRLSKSRRKREKVERTIDILRQRFVQSSTTCNRCDGVARPVVNTLDEYLCPRCGYRFQATRHGIDALPSHVELGPDGLPCPRGSGRFLDLGQAT